MGEGVTAAMHRDAYKAVRLPRVAHAAIKSFMELGDELFDSTVEAYIMRQVYETEAF